VTQVPLFSFRRSNKIKKLLEDGKMEEVVKKALENEKIANHLVELLDDKNPGIVGDSLMVISMVIKENPNAVRITQELIEKIFDLLATSKVAYVKDGAMALLLELAKNYGNEFRESFSKGVEKLMKKGDKSIVAFALLLIKELKLSQFKDTVTSLLEVEDKVILPFKGRRWVRIGDIAREVLDSL